MTAQVRVTTPAKINLCLGVGPVRPDGYHPLATVYQAVSLYDEVLLSPLPDDVHADDAPPAGDDLRITVSAEGDGVDATSVPSDGTNLAARAVRLLGRHVGQELRTALHVRKRIPVAGGLAGGSSDAAAALLGADLLFELHTPRDELLALAAELGSDVPFCLTGGTAMGSGRGELVTPVMTRGEYWWVVVPDAGGLSTPAVYGEFDRLQEESSPLRVAEPEVPHDLLSALAAGDAELLGAALSNDLQPAALSFRPDLGELMQAGLDCSALGALVSGSGPTTAFLCRSPGHAEQLSQALDAIATRTGRDLGAPLVVKGPVGGAKVTGVHR
jgi:4-diphosphocytidyl-2-C-methyl-D-erythritol kinase